MEYIYIYIFYSFIYFFLGGKGIDIYKIIDFYLIFI